MGLVSEERTAVHIAVAGVERSLFEHRGVPLGYLFLPGTRREHPHKMCRRFPTSARAFSCCWPLPDVSLDAGPVPRSPRHMMRLRVCIHHCNQKLRCSTTRIGSIFLHQKVRKAPFGITDSRQDQKAKIRALVAAWHTRYSTSRPDVWWKILLCRNTFPREERLDRGHNHVSHIPCMTS